MALTDSLRAYWKLDESSGNPTDSSGNGYTLTNTNTVGFSAALIGNGADGGATNTNKELVIDSNLGIATAPADISVSLWVKMNTEIGSSQQKFFEKTLNVASNLHGISAYYQYNGGTRRLAFARQRHGVGDDYVYYNITLGTTNWYHIVYTYNGTTVLGYVNSVQRATMTSNGATTGSDGTLTTRFDLLCSNTGYPPDAFLSGIIDEVGVWSRVLTTDEITSLYNSGAGLAYPFSAGGGTVSHNMGLMGIGK